MQIYLSKPGGQKEGPFTLEQIKAGQRRGLFGENEFWAWYEGQTDWVPLYAVPGMSGVGPSSPEPVAATQAAAARPATATPPAAPAAAEPGPTPEREAKPDTSGKQLSSGLPLSALDHMFVLTTGDGPSIMREETSAHILCEVVGADVESQRKRAPRDVISHCKWVAEFRKGGTVPDAAWKVMSSLRPELVASARGGDYKICVRTYPVGENDMVALFLFYNKKLLLASA